MAVIRVLKHISAKTSIKGDSHTLELIQKPIFISLLIFVFIQAKKVLQMRENIMGVTIALLKMIVILYWTAFAIKFSKFLLTIISTGKTKKVKAN